MATTPPRRSSDEMSDDFSRTRQSGNSLEFGFGRYQLKASGALVLVLLGLLAIIGSQLYVGFEIRRASSAEHQAVIVTQGHLFNAQDRLSCIVAMSNEERRALREDYRAGAFARWCPWVREPDR